MQPAVRAACICGISRKTFMQTRARETSIFGISTERFTLRPGRVRSVLLKLFETAPPSPHTTLSMLSPSPSQQSITVKVITDSDDVEIEVITGSGDVEVEGLEGGLQVTTGSGNIRVSGKPASDWKLDTGAGTVRVLFALGANLILEAHTSSGTIRTQDSVTVHGKSTPHELRGQVGE